MPSTLSLGKVKEHLMTLVEQEVLNAADTRIMMAIVRAVIKKGKCDLNNTKLAEVSGVNRIHIIRVLKKLHQMGLLSSYFHSPKIRDITFHDEVLRKMAMKSQKGNQDGNGEESVVA